MSASARFRRLAALSPAERRVLAEALVLMPFASAALRLGGLRRARALLARFTRRRQPRRSIPAATIARLVSVASRRGPVRGKCLSAALTLESLLRRYGMEGELRLGVRRLHDRFEAHAWVEYEGVALMEPEGIHSRYAAFAGPIAPRA